jgi:hypothetical protein
MTEPVATGFQSSGAGNGFPFCLEKVNVYSADYWTTLSGWSRENTPIGAEKKEESIGDSHKQAMQLYWNWYSTDTVGTFADYFQSVNNPGGREDYFIPLDIIQEDDVNFPETKPRERICSGVSGFIAESDGSASARGDFSLGGLKRFYNGSTDNENNYVGVGYNPSFFGSNIIMKARSSAPFISTTVWLHGGVYTEEIFFPPLIGETKYTEIDGFHLVCVVAASATAVDIGDIDDYLIMTINAEDAEASVDRFDATISPPGFIRSQCAVKINSFNFYTYP